MNAGERADEFHYLVTFGGCTPDQARKLLDDRERIAKPVDWAKVAQTMRTHADSHHKMSLIDHFQAHHILDKAAMERHRIISELLYSLAYSLESGL